MRVSEIIRTEVVAAGMNGEGVCRPDGVPVFVPFAAVGDVLDVRITGVRSGYAFGRVEKVVCPSPDRETPPCPVFGRCGGCAYQHVSFAAENAYKRDYLKGVLEKEGIDADVKDTVSGSPYRSRNKLQMPFFEKNGRTALGLYRRNTHECVETEDCLLQGQWAAPLLRAVLSWANGRDRENLPVYDELTKTGLLRHLCARCEDGFLAVTAVVNGGRLPGADRLYSAVSRTLDCALYVSENRESGNAVMGKKTRLVRGEEREITVSGLRMRLSPAAFFQVNDEIREALYSAVSAAVSPSDVVLDVYSGAGLLTAVIAKALPDAAVYGIEKVREAVLDADRLVSLNGLSSRVSNVLGDAETELPGLVRRVSGGGSLRIVLDPPRKGCAPEVLKAVCASGAERIAYVSCNPATLCRDLRVLKERYAVSSVTPYNMFPRTAGIESLSVLDLS